MGLPANIPSRKLDVVDDQRLDAQLLELPNGQVVRRAPFQAISPYVQVLRSVHGIYRMWADDPTRAFEDIDTVSDDAVVRASVRHVGLSAAGSDFAVVPGDDMYEPAAKLCEQAFRHIPDFTHARMILARAILRGLSLSHVEWSRQWRRLLPDVAPRWWWMPVRITEVDKRRLRLLRSPGRKDVAYWSIYDPGLDEYVVIEDRSLNPRAAITMQDFIWYYADLSERSAGYGEGDADQLLELVKIKRQVIQYFATLAERWSEPTFIAKVDEKVGALTATLGQYFENAKDRLTKVGTELEKWRARHTIGLGKNDELDIVEHGGQTADRHESFIRLLNEEIRTVVLGANATGEQSRGSGLGSDRGTKGNQKDALEAVIEYHQTRMEESETRWLVNEWVRRNTPSLIEAGCPIPYDGDLKMRHIHQAARSIEERKFTLATLREWQRPVEEEEFYELVGSKPPAAGDVVVTAPDPKPEGAPGGGFGGMPAMFARRPRPHTVPTWRQMLPQQFAANHDEDDDWYGYPASAWIEVGIDEPAVARELVSRGVAPAMLRPVAQFAFDESKHKRAPG